MKPFTPKAIAVAIVGVLTPLILALAAFIANEAQILFNMHLEGVALAGYISAFLIVVITGGVKLLEHGGKALIAALAADVLKAAGEQLTPAEEPQPPPAPPAATAAPPSPASSQAPAWVPPLPPSK